MSYVKKNSASFLLHCLNLKQKAPSDRKLQPLSTRLIAQVKSERSAVASCHLDLLFYVLIISRSLDSDHRFALLTARCYKVFVQI